MTLRHIPKDYEGLLSFYLKNYVHAQANLFHPWHQHWAETICCQQLSLLAQTFPPLGEQDPSHRQREESGRK